jgi:hypothetical protein
MNGDHLKRRNRSEKAVDVDGKIAASCLCDFNGDGPEPAAMSAAGGGGLFRLEPVNNQRGDEHQNANNDQPENPK